MTVNEQEMFVIDLIVTELNKEENDRALENLKTLRRNYFVETGDISTGEPLTLLIKHGLAYRVEHLHDYNVPDFGITQRGMLVFEEYKHRHGTVI